MKTKIVEAFGFGKAVICDSLSAKALPDLFARSGVKPAESYSEAYECLRRVLNGSTAVADIQSHVRENYSWQGLMGRFVEFWNLCSTWRPQPPGGQICSAARLRQN